MTTKRFSLIAAFCLSFFFFEKSQAQDKPLTEAEKQTVIDSITKLLNDNYVFPDVAKQMEEHVKSNLKNGKYATTAEPQEFSQKLTQDLQSISHDKHLRVNFAPQEITRMREREKLPPEERPDDWIKDMQFENFGFKEVKIMEGNVGYLDLRGFMPALYGGETAAAAMSYLSNCSAIIFDLRNNGGGDPTMIQLLTSYLYSGEDPVHLNNFYWRPENKNTQTWTLPYVSGKRNPKAEVYVLTSNRTFSAAEEFTYNLKNLKRATIVGETTGGGAHPGGSMIATDRFMVWVPQGRAINPITNTNWEGTGVEPDIKVPKEDALSTAHLAALEKLATTADEPFKAVYEWYIPILKAKTKPVKVDESTLKSYAGKYGPRVLTYEKGKLYYQREGNSRYELTALDEDLFMFEEASYFRLKMVKENGKVVGLKGLYDNGRVDENKREPGQP